MTVRKELKTVAHHKTGGLKSQVKNVTIRRRKTAAPRFGSLEHLRDWLATKPARGRYDADDHTSCLIVQYVNESKNLKLVYFEAYRRILVKDFDEVSSVAHETGKTSSSTFGAALKRANKFLALRAIAAEQAKRKAA